MRQTVTSWSMEILGLGSLAILRLRMEHNFAVVSIGIGGPLCLPERREGTKEKEAEYQDWLKKKIK